jgi:hypothetical protein
MEAKVAALEAQRDAIVVEDEEQVSRFTVWCRYHWLWFVFLWGVQGMTQTVWGACLAAGHDAARAVV